MKSLNKSVLLKNDHYFEVSRKGQGGDPGISFTRFLTSSWEFATPGVLWVVGVLLEGLTMEVGSVADLST